MTVNKETAKSKSSWVVLRKSNITMSLVRYGKMIRRKTKK